MLKPPRDIIVLRIRYVNDHLNVINTTKKLAQSPSLKDSPRCPQYPPQMQAPTESNGFPLWRLHHQILPRPQQRHAKETLQWNRQVRCQPLRNPPLMASKISRRPRRQLPHSNLASQNLADHCRQSLKSMEKLSADGCDVRSTKAG